MSHTFTRTTGLSRTEMTWRIVARLGYTVDADGVVYFSSEEGGQPLGTLSELSDLLAEHGCLGPRTPQGRYTTPDALACRRLDRMLFERSLAPAA